MIARIRAAQYTLAVLLRILIAAAFALVLGVPFLLRPSSAGDSGKAAARRLVIVTPHVPQIHAEFSRGFESWHRRTYGEGVTIDWRLPGGTSEILKQLEAQFTAAARAGAFDFSDPKNPTCKSGTIGYDLMFGGGSFDHTRLKTGIKVKVSTARAPGAKVDEGKTEVDVSIPMSVPAGFSKDQLDAWYGENVLGAGYLYEPEQYWMGAALSSFGIVYNKDVYRRLGMEAPESFEDLCDTRLAGWVALADPRQSGSVATTFEAILAYYGWEKGWRVLREMSANTRYFTNSSPKPPIDISAGEAAAGLAIDFYGRGQSQAVLLPGQDASESRVGYVDPKGAVYMDADPVSVLRGGPDPQLARRFVEYCLTEEGQAIWQFHAIRSGAGGGNPKIAGTDELMGPLTHELRRLPARRVMYEKYLDHFIDPVDPFTLASKTKPNKDWRPLIGVMMGAFGIDTAHDQRAAWRALQSARGNKAFPSERLAEMERLFYAWPETKGEGGPLAFVPENAKAIRDCWRKRGQDLVVIEYTTFFRENYRRVVALKDATGGS